MDLKLENELLRKADSLLGERTDKYLLIFTNKDNTAFMYTSNLRSWDLMGYLEWSKEAVRRNMDLLSENNF